MERVFEEWFLMQFGDDKKGMLKSDKSEKGGYIDETVNALWIGFNAGALWRQADA